MRQLIRSLRDVEDNMLPFVNALVVDKELKIGIVNDLLIPLGGIE